MAISVSQPSVTNAATLLASNASTDSNEGDYRAKRYLVKNITATAPVFLGNSAVTTGNGFQWDAIDGALAIELEPGESVYGIVATGSQTVHVLALGR